MTAIAHPIKPRKIIQAKISAIKCINNVRIASDAAATVKLLIWPIVLSKLREPKQPRTNPKPYIVGIIPMLLKVAPARFALRTIVGETILLAS